MNKMEISSKRKEFLDEVEDGELNDQIVKIQRKKRSTEERKKQLAKEKEI